MQNPAHDLDEAIGSVLARAAAASRRSLGSVQQSVQVTPSPLSTRAAVADKNYTVRAWEEFVAYTSLTAARSVTIPEARTCPNRILRIKDEAGTAAANNITVTGTIDGAGSATISTNYGSLTIYSSGKAWFTL